MKRLLILPVLLIALVATCAAQTTYQWKTRSSGGYTYRYVTNDPIKARFYTLKNGLTVVLSKNTMQPLIEFRLAVRAGSNTDPETATGLAHYLEHMLFKGTDKIGTLDYAKEKPLLDQIEALYEQYRTTTDSTKRTDIYTRIDQVSGEAAKYAAANEYDRLMKSIGGTMTNAHTYFEETVYKENFSSNAIDQFLLLQAERFRNPVFRIFHTELETVYEEKNRGMDDDDIKVQEVLLDKLFPTHNYGQQNTIGTIAHLKNPSLSEIRKYYNKYYVPNNMMLCFSGDFEPDEMIRKIDRAFNYMKPKPFNQYAPAPEKPLTSVQQADVYGPGPENVRIAYRGPAQGTRESLLLKLISGILSNDKAGLIDIYLNQQQKVQYASAAYQQMKDYGIFGITVQPKDGQTVEQARELAVQQINLLKQGKFDETLIKAIVANNKLNLLYEFAENGMRVNNLVNEFILNRGENWDQTLRAPDAMGKITKAEIVSFANIFFRDNYVVVYKRQGEDKHIVRVEKPRITPVVIDPSRTSEFAKAFYNMPMQPILPKFLDYRKDLQTDSLGGLKIISVQNVENSLFSMTYRFDIGKLNSLLLPYAAQYLPLLGTDQDSAEEIKRQFFNIACDYNFSVDNENATIYISGLQENFAKAVSLVEHIFSNCKVNEEALADMKTAIIRERANSKSSKSDIMEGLAAYARYGESNPFNYNLSNDSISKITGETLLALLHRFMEHKHTITYYGPKTIKDFKTNILHIHQPPAAFLPIPPAKQFSYTRLTSNQVYFVNYDMVQAEISWVRNDTLAYDPTVAGKIGIFNSYFGDGMSSVVFSNIRESKALAYSTYAFYSSPNRRTKPYVMAVYVGTQADKLAEALTGMNELLNDLPQQDKAFEIAKASQLNNIEANRINRERIMITYMADQKLGFQDDARINKYEQLKGTVYPDIKRFHEQHIAGKAYSYCVIASENRVSMKELEGIGAVERVSLERVFGF